MAPPSRSAPVSDRATYGKRLRDVVPRGDQARWQLPADRDVLARLAGAEQGRLPELLRVKYAKMATSPFAFLRGGAPVMAPDLAAQPSTGYEVQLCGDAHTRNLGAYATGDGTIVFDVNDFDETCRGPWEWDLRRLVTSVVLMGREADCSDTVCRDAARAAIAAWREAMNELAQMTHLELSRHRVQRFAPSGAVGRALEKAERMTPIVARDRLAAPDEENVPRFKDNRLSEWIARNVIASLAMYRDTLDAARQQVFDGYEPYDVALKIAGTGSLGVRNYVVLCRGNGDDDPLLLQVKQAMPSCYRSLGLVTETVAHEGQRVAEGALRCQTAIHFSAGPRSTGCRSSCARSPITRRRSISAISIARRSSSTRACAARRSRKRTRAPAIRSSSRRTRAAPTTSISRSATSRCSPPIK